MLEGVNYDEAKSEVDYYKYLEPSLAIFEDYYYYLNSNDYENIIVKDFSIHGRKLGVTSQLFFDVAKYNQYILKIWDTYNLVFRYEDGKYRLNQMDVQKEFNNINEIIEYINSVSNKTI